MTCEEVLEWLAAHANPEFREGMVRFGIDARLAVGVRVVDLRRLAREIGRDHALALELYRRPVHEGRILASMIADTALFRPEEMDAWVAEFRSWDLCDQCCINLFRYTSYAYGKVKFNMLYLQVPVVVSWHFNVRSVSIQPLAGVFYGFGIHGKAKFKGEKADLFKSTDLGDGAEEEAMFKRSDLGLRFGANVTFKKHYNVSLGYDLGLLNILKDADEVKAKNGSFFVSLGYNF